MKARIILMILLAIAVLISVLIIARGSESSRVISNQAQTIENLEELVNRKDFAWTASDLEVDNLEQTILSQQERIQELMVKEQVLEDAKDMLEYSLTYIYFVQVVMDKNGLIYPEFIIESILVEGLDDVEELEE